MSSITLLHDLAGSHQHGRKESFVSSNVGPPNLFSKFNVGEGNREILDGVTLDNPFEIFV